MIVVIVTETNRRANVFMNQLNEQNGGKEKRSKNTDCKQMCSFIAPLILAGVYRSNNENWTICGL